MWPFNWLMSWTPPDNLCPYRFGAGEIECVCERCKAWDAEEQECKLIERPWTP
jgi:hypothetical protein